MAAAADHKMAKDIVLGVMEPKRQDLEKEGLLPTGEVSQILNKNLSLYLLG